MAGIFEVKDLEAKKRALAAESDLYRQMVHLEIRNLELYAKRMQRSITSLAAIKPLLSLGAPLVGSLFGKRQAKWMRLAEAAFAGWQLSRKFSAVFRRGEKVPAAQRARAV